MVACTCAVYRTTLPCSALPILDVLIPSYLNNCPGLRLLQQIQTRYEEYSCVPTAYRSERVVQYLARWLASLNGENWRVRCWARMGRISGGPHLDHFCASNATSGAGSVTSEHPCEAHIGFLPRAGAPAGGGKEGPWRNGQRLGQAVGMPTPRARRNRRRGTKALSRTLAGKKV